MGIIINLNQEREKRKNKEEEAIIKEMRASLNNSEVMKRYKIAEPSAEERMERVKESIKRVNSLLAELNQVNKKDGDK